MKLLQRFWMKLVILVSIAALAGCNMSLTRSMPANFKSYGHKIVSSDEHPVRSGDSSRRFEVRAGDCSWSGSWSDCEKDRERHELKSGLFSDGEYWFTWSLYLPEDFKNIYPVKLALGQFHQRDGDPAWMFQNRDGGYTLENSVIGTSLDSKKIFTDQEMRGKWVDVLVHVNFTHQQQGFFRLYANGESTPRYAWSGPTKTKGLKVYYKVGIYRSFMSRSPGPEATQIVYFDDIAKGSQCADVAKHFDCSAIIAGQSDIKDTNDYIKLCDGKLCPAVYDRTVKGLNTRFACWLASAQKSGKSGLPSDADVQRLITNIKGYKYSMLSRAIQNKGMPEAVMARHGKAINRLVSYTRSSAEFCEKPEI